MFTHLVCVIIFCLKNLFILKQIFSLECALLEELSLYAVPAAQWLERDLPCKLSQVQISISVLVVDKVGIFLGFLGVLPCPYYYSTITPLSCSSPFLLVKKLTSWLSSINCVSDWLQVDVPPPFVHGILSLR